MVNGIRVCQSKVFDLYPTMASVINEEPPYNQEPRIRKTATASNVKGEESDPEKNIHHTKNSTNDIIEVAEEIEFVSLVNYCFQHVDSLTISRDIEAIDAGSANYCLGCCKLDSVNQKTENRFSQEVLRAVSTNAAETQSVSSSRSYLKAKIIKSIMMVKILNFLSK